MAQVTGKVIAHINIKISMWQAIKLRVAGLLKNAATYEQLGALVKITYKTVETTEQDCGDAFEANRYGI